MLGQHRTECRRATPWRQDASPKGWAAVPSSGLVIFKFFSTLGDSLVLRTKLTITGQDGGQGSGSRDGQNEVVCPVWTK